MFHLTESTYSPKVLSRWSLDSMEWYEVASEYTGYHLGILDQIKAYLKLEDEVCEIACGTGNLARAIAPFVKKITANDIDSTVIHHVQEKVDQSGIQNMTVLQGDWQVLFNSKTFDIVIFSFFGSILKDWHVLKTMAKRNIIAILPCAETKEKTELKSSQIPEYMGMRKRETLEMASVFLTELGVPFTTILLNLDFGQPLSQKQDFIAYFKHYYHMEEGPQMDALMDAALQPINEGWYLPKEKKIGIMVISVNP